MIKKLPANLLQIKVQLNGFSPSNYRTFLLSEDDDFLDLHIYIQQTFGFEDCHLWHFTKKEKKEKFLEIIFKDEFFIGEYYMTTKEPHKTKLKNIFIKQGIKKLDYKYDFGDSWEFEVTCQKIIPYNEKLKFPKLIKSNGLMLLEDCGGVWGLSQFIEDYNNKTFNDDVFDDWKSFEKYMKPVFTEINVDKFKL